MEPDRLRTTIASAQAGDASAYEALLQTYGPRLYGYFLRATGRHHDAEDLLGEMMLKLVRQLNRYDDRGRFEPWLFRIAANMVRDRYRRRKTAPRTLSLSEESPESGSLAEGLSADGPGVEARLDFEEASAELSDALAALDESTREMILLRHFGGMTFKEIAAACDCPIGTALAKVHRGLAALRRRMGA